MDVYILAFRSMTEIEGFSLDDFENRVEAFDEANPGEGYQIVYQETLKEWFQDIVEKYMMGKSTIVDPESMVHYFDSQIIKPYLKECEKQGITGVNIKTNEESAPGLNQETLQTLKSVIDGAVTPVRAASFMYEMEQLPLAEAAKYASDREKKIPSRGEAITMISYAKGIEQVHKKRKFRDILANLSLHFKEWRTIRALKKIAKKTSNYEELVQEAVNGNSKFVNLKKQVEDKLIAAQKGEKPQEVIQRDSDLILIDNDVSDMEQIIEIQNALKNKNPNANEQENILDGLDISDNANLSEYEVKGRESQYLDLFDKYLDGEEEVDNLDNARESRVSVRVDEVVDDGEDLDLKSTLDTMENNSEVTFDENKTAEENFSRLKDDISFSEKIFKDVIEVVGKPGFNYIDEYEWVSFNLFDKMMNDSEEICKDYDEWKNSGEDKAVLDEKIKTGINKLYETAYTALDTIMEYDSCVEGFTLEEKPIIAQKLTDLFLNNATPVGFKYEELGEYAENYVITNRDHAINVMLENENGIGKDQCEKIVDNATKELHAFDRVEFDENELDGPKEAVNLSDLVVENPKLEKNVNTRKTI